MGSFLASIPFRSSSEISGAYMLWVGLATILVLAGVFVVLAYAKKRGWLDKWTMSRAATLPSRGDGWTLQSQRVGHHIVMHTLERAGQALVLVESRSGVSVTVLPSQRGVDGEATR